MLFLPLTLTTMLPARIFPPGPPRPPSPPLPAQLHGEVPFEVFDCVLGVEVFCEGVATFCGLLGVVATGESLEIVLVVGFVSAMPARERVSVSANAKSGNIEKSTASKTLCVMYVRVMVMCEISKFLL